MQPFIELKNLTKRFGNLVANQDISLEIVPGEVVALLGENGAGKTTLSKMLYGLYQADEGEIHIRGQAVRLRSPADAINQGIGFVSQHFALVPSLTVTENIVLGREGSNLLNTHDLNQRITTLAQRFSMQIKPEALVATLSVGEQQRIEILKALYRDCKLLILDEPTAVLTPQDTEQLFSTLRTLQQIGLSVIIITHKLEEALSISQRVAVLRHGKLVGILNTQDTSKEELTRLMVGRDTLKISSTENTHSSTKILSVNDLSYKDKRGLTQLENVFFDLHHGEVLGIAAVAGNGQSELIHILSGMIQPQGGSISYKNQTVVLSPGRATQLGIGRIPEERMNGVVGELTVAENLALEHLGSVTHNGVLNHKRILETAQQLIQDFQIKANPRDKIRTLSGGNIQKVILARTLSKNPEVIIAAQPTRGLDIGASEYVHQKLLEQKTRGAAILLTSEDLDELVRLSDRILVMYKGCITGEFAKKDADIQTLGLLMAGSRAAA
jgi:general nucleoside transport system ATP-binding protein